MSLPLRAVSIPFLLGCLLAAHPDAAPDQTTDLRPLPDDRNPVAMAASPFHVWIATRTSLSRWSRIGNDAPVWYGPGHGLPSMGIVSACWDDRTNRLLLQGADGLSYGWSENTQRATQISTPVANSSTSPTPFCESSISRLVGAADLPNLIPEAPGWMYQDGDLKEPGGRTATVRLAMVIEDRDLWLATTTAGIWKGRWPSGRVTPLSSGLGETCIEHAVAESDGTVWILGCGGNMARLSTDGSLQSIDPRSPRWYDLHHAIDLAPAPNGGVWVAVPTGIVRATAGGIVDRRLDRKAPFGGSPVALASLGDTAWCQTAHGLSASVGGKLFKPLPRQDSALPFRILSIAPTRQGLLAGTTNGFRLWDGAKWIRPSNLDQASSRPVRKIAVEPGNDRIAWSDGSIVLVDTLPGSHGATGVWGSPSNTLHDFAWDGEGRLHIAHGAWTIWNPEDGTAKTWSLPVQAEIVVPGSPWTFIGGTTGGMQARTSSWSP